MEITEYLPVDFPCMHWKKNCDRGILRWKAGTGSGFPGGQAMRNTEPQAV